MATSTWLNERTSATFWAALVSGGALAMVGFLASGFNAVATPISLLIICSGLSIVLGAFGATATLKYQGVTVAGVAAISMVLFMMVMHELRYRTALVEVGGFPRGSRVDLHAGGLHFLGAERGERHDLYQFVVFAEDLRAGILGLTVTVPATGPGTSESDLIFNCIARADVERALGLGMSLQWRIDAAGRRLVSNTRPPKPISPMGECPDDTAPSASFADWRALSPISIAHASGTVVSEALSDLSADSSAIRGDARRAIATQGIDAIRPLMDHWKAEPDSYRVRVGAVVALAEMLRGMKPQKSEVSAQLTEDDLKRLVAAAGDDDRTVRIYASEFLYDLADKRVVPAVLERMRVADDDGRYNLVLVLSGVAPDLAPQDRAALRNQLETYGAEGLFGPRTQELLKKL